MKINSETKQKAKNAYVVCIPCGQMFGRTFVPAKDIKTQRKSKCGICERTVMVADFKVFGFSKF